MPLIKIANSAYLTRTGKLVNRKAHRRLIKKVATLSEAKKKVKGYRKILSQLQEMTAKDPSGKEFGVVTKKVGKGSKMIKGEMFQGRPVLSLRAKDSVTMGHNQVLLHSHPGSKLNPASPLSLEDVLGTQKRGAVFAIDLEGNTFRTTPKVGRKENSLIKQAWNDARQKIRDSGVVSRLIDEQKFANPNVRDLDIKADILPVAQHKLMDAMHKKGLVHYRAKLTPTMKRRLNKYKDLMDIELSSSISLANFTTVRSKPTNTNYKHIPKSKWNKLPKKTRNDIRAAENSGNNKRVIGLYKKASV